MMPDASVNPTIREVYQLVGQAKGELLAEIDKVSTMVEARLTVHQTEHKAENDRRSSLIRWAVTSVMTGVGVLIAIYVGVR